MNELLIKSILAMDSYNRGYGEKIKIDGDSIGNYTILTDSLNQGFYDERLDESIGFYGVAYQGNGETIISYRGTDDSKDPENGWGVGTGSHNGPQAEMAIDFYKSVADSLTPPGPNTYLKAGVSTVGHSLGGGLASFIGALYQVDSQGFNSMAFESAVESAIAETDYFFVEKVYAGYVPWLADFSGVNLINIEDEILDVIDVDPSFTYERAPDSIEIPLYDNGALGPIEKHSMSTMVIRLFATEPEVGAKDGWQTSGRYFWRSLYEESIANKVGYDTVEGLDGSIKKMRSAIAYSAVNEGTTVFGDTAIRALYNDANELGDAMDLSDFSHALHFNLTNISNLFVGYAGRLALDKIVQDSENEHVLDGVLVFRNDYGEAMLNVDLSTDKWRLSDESAAADLAVLDILKQDFIAPIMTSNAYTTGNRSLYDSLMEQHWGSSSLTQFDSVTFALDSSKEAWMEAPKDSQHASLYASSIYDVVDNVKGSDGKDLIITQDGADTIWGSSGEDIIDGGDGDDIVNYRSAFRANELKITWSADGSIAVMDTADSTDLLYNIEEIQGRYNGINTLAVSGAGDFQEISNGVYEFNGNRLILADVAKIEGDASKQIFTLNFMPEQGVYGLGGGDVLNLNINGGISNQITGDFYQDQLLLPINAYTDIDDVNFTGTPTTLVVDPYENGAVLERGYNDYSASDNAAEFDLVAYTDIDALDFIGLNYAFEQLFYTAVDTGLAQQYGDGYSANGIGSRYSVYNSARHDHTIGVAHFRGTDHGDDVLIRSDNFLPTDIDFVAGYGDDAIDVGYSRPGGSTSVTYTKGNDTISGGDRAITDIKMWSAIRPSDVSISGDVITVNGYGTITLEGISAADVVINFLGTERAATIDGSWGSESWAGYDGRDEAFYGLGGDDVLNGNGGQDYLYGGTGNDTLYSLKGANVLEGGLGDDVYYASKIALTTITDQYGNNALYATDFTKADMHFVLNADGHLVMEDAAGNATVTINRDSALDHIEFLDDDTITLAEAINEAQGNVATYNTSEGRDTVFGRGVEGLETVVELKGGNDSFYGSSRNISETVYGGDGREFMVTGLGNDTLYGGKGDDYHLNGEEGDDYIDGGEGRDTYILTDYMYNGQSSGHGGHVDLSLGIAYNDGLGGTDTLVSIEGVVGTKYDDLIIGDDADNYFSGAEGNDTLYGMGGDDSFEFTEDYDAGDSAFVDGGEGNDRLYYGYSEDYRIVADLGAGIVSENGRGGQDIIVSIENIVGSALGGDHITGSDERNEIYLEGFYGEGGVVFGMGGNDAIYGGYYDDTLSGGDGADTLLGRDGNDTLIGGAGNDTLEGGAGDDTYVFAAGDGIDIIRDTEGENILIIEGDIALDDLVTTRRGNDLILHIASGVTFENYYESEPADNAFTLAFTDGTQVDAKAVEVNNAAPVAQDDAFDLQQNSTITGNVLYDNGYGEDADPDADTIEVVAGSFMTEFGGTLQLSEDGSFTYTPEQDFSGFDTVSYSITDGYEGTDTAEISFFVGSVNTGPEANDDDVLAEEDTAIIIDVLANDNDADGDAFNVSIEDGPLNGSVAINSDQTITYTPHENYNGDDSFTYSVDDGHGGSDTATVSLNVSAVNDNPVAQNDTANAQYNQALLLTAAQLIANDSDLENDALEIAAVYNAQNGVAVLNSDGSMSFTPETNYSGAASFEYTLSDGNGGTSTATVNIEVGAPPNNNDVLYGTEGNDNLFGTRESDIIEAQGGDDRVFARNGHDEVHGGTGDDKIFGGNGDDLLYGNDGDDFLFGQRGSNEMDGGAGDDLLAGSSGRDLLFGEEGDDLLLGNNGNDVLDGGLGDDRLYGGRGDDLLFFGEGSDYLYGGSGRDVFKALAADGIERSTIRDFEAKKDVLDISDVLTGYDPVADLLSDFVNVEASRSRATVYIDRDGTGTEHAWEQLVQMQIKGASNLSTDEDQLVNDGVLVI